jgi:adenylate cyclase
MTNPISSGSKTQSTATPIYRLRLLGGFELRDGRDRPIELRTRKSRLLLSILATTDGGSCSRQLLATMLWGDREEAQARGSLRNALSDIRAAMGSDSLIARGEDIALAVGLVASDVDQLAGVTSGQEDLQATSLLDVYPGEFLSGQDHDGEAFDSWLAARRHTCREMAAKFLTIEIDRLKALGQLKLSIERARELLSLDPLSEESHRLLMQLYAEAGERSLALAQFRSCSLLLQRELSVAPSSQTQRLAEKISRPDGYEPSAIPVPAIAPVQQVSEPVLSKQSDRPSIAIVPFTNMGGDAEQDYFSEGITEDIATDLADGSNFDVIAPSTVAAYQSAATPLRQLGTEFGAQYALDGSVRRHGDNVRVTARLIETDSGKQVWASRYDRAMANIFELQGEIAAAIVSALNHGIGPKSTLSPARRSTHNIEAYEEYLRGRTYLREMTQQSVELSRKMFRRAVDLDPTYALAYAGLAESEAMFAFHYSDDLDILKDALKNCNEALRLEPELSEVYAARGVVLSIMGNYDEAEKELRTSIKINPQSHQAQLYLGLQLLTTGTLEGSVPAMKAARELAPQDLQTVMMNITLMNALELPEEILSISRHALDLAQRRLAANPHDDRAAYVGAQALYNLGRKEEAQQWLDLAASFDVGDVRSIYNLACTYCYFGDTEKCLIYLQRLIDVGCSKRKLDWAYNYDPDLNNVRQDPRFKAMFTRSEA